MTVRSVTLCLAVLCATVVAGPVFAESGGAAGKFAEGNALLAKADFEGAFAAYDAAAKADPENAEYRVKTMLLRRVMKMHEGLDELEAEKWLPTATALHCFYQDNGVCCEALSLAQRIHAKEPTAESTAMLARDQLAVGKSSEALETLRGLPEDEVCAETCVLMGLGLARQGKIAKAKAVLGDVKEPADADGQFLYDLACLHAAAGDPEDALRALKGCFERTSAGRLKFVKARARCCDDLAALRDNPKLAEVFATESKAKSGCGKSCGSKAKSDCKTPCSEGGKTSSEPKKESHSGCPGHDKPKP